VKQPKESGFAERRKTADEAKKLLLQKFAAAPKVDDPEVIAKRAEREAAAIARTERQAERDREKAEAREAAKIAKAEAEATAAADAIAREAAAEQQKELSAEERKAERDRRYAARKARQR